MRDGMAATRRIELAEIERWFSSDALGAIFHAADGRAWPIDDAAAARGKARAVKLVDAMLDGGRRQIVVLVLAAIAGSLLVPLLPASWRGAVFTVAGVVLYLGLHLAAVARLALYRIRLRRLRAEIAAGMAGPSFDATDPARYARTNIFRVAQSLWILACLVSVIAWQLGALPALGGPAVLLAIAVAMGTAWGLYFAAEQVDRVQAKPRERLSRHPYSARDSWSQAD